MCPNYYSACAINRMGPTISAQQSCLQRASLQLSATLSGMKKNILFLHENMCLKKYNIFRDFHLDFMKKYSGPVASGTAVKFPSLAAKL